MVNVPDLTETIAALDTSLPNDLHEKDRTDFYEACGTPRDALMGLFEATLCYTLGVGRLLLCIEPTRG
jgi:hypothetical protein